MEKWIAVSAEVKVVNLKDLRKLTFNDNDSRFKQLYTNNVAAGRCYALKWEDCRTDTNVRLDCEGQFQVQQFRFPLLPARLGTHDAIHLPQTRQTFDSCYKTDEREVKASKVTFLKEYFKFLWYGTTILSLFLWCNISLHFTNLFMPNILVENIPPFLIAQWPVGGAHYSVVRTKCHCTWDEKELLTVNM